jgi:predicted nucleic acid-binding protein
MQVLLHTLKHLDQLIERDEVVISKLIRCEILVGIRDDDVFEKTKSFLEGFEVVDDADPKVLNQAVTIYRTCRKNGITVRTLVDCIIAAVALRTERPLFAKDRDFDNIKRVFPLNLVTVK